MRVRDYFTGERHSKSERCSPARRSCVCIIPITSHHPQLDSLPRLEEDHHGKNYTSDCWRSNNHSQQSASFQSSNLLSQTTCSARQPVQSNNLLGQTICLARQPDRQFQRPTTLDHRSERHTTITHAPAVHPPRLRQTLLDRRRIPTRLHIEQFHFKRRTRTSRKQKEDTTEERQQESPGGAWLHDGRIQ